MRLTWRLSACCSQRASGQLRRRCCYLLLLLPVACVCVRTKLPQSTFSPKLSLAFVVSSPSSPLSRAISSSQTTPSRTVCRQLRRALACPICIEGNNLRPLKSCAHCVRARLPVARRLTRTKALWHERNSLDTTEGPRGRRRRHWRAHSYSARSLARWLPSARWLTCCSARQRTTRASSVSHSLRRARPLLYTGLKLVRLFLKDEA